MAKSHLPTRKELRQFFILAIPLSAAYLSEYAMFLTTKLVIGKLGYHSLAAVGIAGHLSFELLLIAMAMLSIISVLAAQAHGANDKQEVGKSVKQGFIFASFFGIPIMLGIWNLDLVLIATGQDPEVVRQAIPYLKGLAPIVMPTLWFAVFRNYVTALAQTFIIMVITVTAVLVNYLLTYWFVFGGFGLEPLGMFGAGLAITITTWLMFLAMTLYIFKNKKLRGYGIFTTRWVFDYQYCKEIFWLGLPIAGIAILEAGLFVAVAILSGVISAKTLAANEIVMAWAGIPFVLAFGLAEATMVRVAFEAGAGRFSDARRQGYLGMGLVCGILTVLIVVPLTLAQTIIGIFLAKTDPGYEEILAMATRLMLIAAVFQIFDGLQATATKALRGIKDNVIPMWIAGVGYWIFGIGGGALLAFPYEMGGEGLWWGMAGGLSITSIMLVLRFRQKMNALN